MLAIRASLQRVTRAVILHAIYYMSKQGIEFDYTKGSLKSSVKAKSPSICESGRNLSLKTSLTSKRRRSGIC